MNVNAYDILKERGFIEQCTDEEGLRGLLKREQVTFYIGYDPTADSLTAGHFLTLMAMAHLQRAGHRPVVLMGTGTGMVGDPTDRNDMRRVMPKAEVDHNINCFRRQLSRFIKFDDGAAILADNGEWLLNLNYLEFIREYGAHFSVNRMLSAETYKARLDSGLTFFEMNYMIMQAYDYLTLYRRHGCRLQFGGNEQWSNIIAGIELIRKIERDQVYGLTLTLLTTGDGAKMGKTAGNAVWLDAEKTSPYEFFQFFRNTSDSNVIKNLSLLTFLPMDEINSMKNLSGSELNSAKERLAYEVTKTVHGEEEAERALSASKTLFAGAEGTGDAMPQTEITASEFGEGINIVLLLEKTGLVESRGDGRRLVGQGGVKLNDKKIESFEYTVTRDDLLNGSAILQKGKKAFHRVTVTDDAGVS